jgi:predicted short-subunit dehydrogenase-like oxidoreductase (DUF2520 family)
MGLALGGALLHAEAVDELVVFGRRPEPPGHPMFMQGRARYVFGVETLDPETTAVFLAIPEEVLPEMAFTLAAHGSAPAGCSVFHLSGTLGTDVLAPLHERGFELGAFHPMVAVRHPVVGASRISGCSIAFTGSPGASVTAHRLAAKTGCEVLPVPAVRRPVVHAASAMTMAFVESIVSITGGVLEQAGWTPEEARAALLHLMRGTLEDIEGFAVSAAGNPIVTGDVETVALHLRALDGAQRTLYARLGTELVGALETGLSDEARGALLNLFQRNLPLDSTSTESS